MSRRLNSTSAGRRRFASSWPSIASMRSARRAIRASIIPGSHWKPSTSAAASANGIAPSATATRPNGGRSILSSTSVSSSVSSSVPPGDASGQLTDGRSFQSIQEHQLLRADQTERLLRSLARATGTDRNPHRRPRLPSLRLRRLRGAGSHGWCRTSHRQLPRRSRRRLDRPRAHESHGPH